MAREQDPGSHIAPGAAGATGSQVSVRRAVPMRGATGDPGDALAPGGRPGRPEEPSGPGGSEAGERGPVNASGETESSGSGAPTAPEARTPAPQTAGADPVRGAGAPAPAASSAPSAPAASSAAVAEGDTATAAARPSSASSEPAAVASSSAPAPGSGGADGATAVAAGPGGGPGARTDEDPPGSRPKKPMLAAAAIAGAVLISVPFLVAGQDDDRKAEKEQTQNAAGTVLDAARPPAPETYTSETPKPSPTPSRKKKEEKKKEPVKPSAPQPLKPVVVTPTPTPTPSPSKQQQKKAASTKAPAGTAAAALEHLAKSDPQGRHICYRAFVAGQGWQVPVCDGTMTGTTGQGKKITALNISVWNVEGSSANALLHDAGAKSGNAKWAPSWTPVIANGKNVYIGSSKAGAPFMTGFAMNVGKGNVCHTAKMRNGGWGPQYCKSSRPDYMFVGTTDNGNWFEAVKLTV
ncbi:hydrogenase expression protein HypA [Streptomyces californicus]|uniref:hydrogenase expression protein HypA n=1 Tax=Streptomyces californicus TaxID=67351 RepID=UPI00296EA6F1|nr:hydrogenase expression protein HypA [Streptomyces californicus]MDW4897121.1 hydrogenase expression protein HypA [Streptomyces californicus]